MNIPDEFKISEKDGSIKQKVIKLNQGYFPNNQFG